MTGSEAKIKAMSDRITDAAHALIGAVRVVEQTERHRAHTTELTCEVELTGGGVETWTITIARTTPPE